MAPLKIEEMFVFAAEDEQGNEGVAAFFNDSMWVPMVGADLRKVEQLRGAAQDIATATGKCIRLLRFTVRQEVEVIKPIGLQG